MSYFSSKYLIAAKALGAKDWSAPAVIKLARHMVREGASIHEISKACGWTVSDMGAQRRLKKFNIRPHPPLHQRAHRGASTEFPHRKSGFNIKSYKCGGRHAA